MQGSRFAYITVTTRPLFTNGCRSYDTIIIFEREIPPPEIRSTIERHRGEEIRRVSFFFFSISLIPLTRFCYYSWCIRVRGTDKLVR